MHKELNGILAALEVERTGHIAKELDNQTAMVAAASLAELMDAFVSVRNHFADNLCGFEIISQTAMGVVCECGKDAEEPFDSSFPWYGLIELNSTDPDLDLIIT